MHGVFLFVGDRIGEKRTVRGLLGRLDQNPEDLEENWNFITSKLNSSTPFKSKNGRLNVTDSF